MKKRGMAIETIVALLIVLIILAIVAAVLAILNGRGIGAIQYLKQIFRFGG